MESTNFELTFVGDDLAGPLRATGLFSNDQLERAVSRGSPEGSPVFSRHLTVYRGGTIVTTAEDYEGETTSATANLQLIVALHKAGCVRLSSINGIQVREIETGI